MVIDFAGCFIVQQTTKYLFASLEPKEMITRGRERRDVRRLAAVGILQTPEAIKQNGLKPDGKSSTKEVPKYLPKA